MKIAEAKLSGKHFVFYGDVSIEEEKHVPVGSLDIEYENLAIMEVVDGTEVPFTMTSYTWSGHKQTEENAVTDILSRYSRNETIAHHRFELIFLCDNIKNNIDVYRTEEALNLNGRGIPYRIFYGPFLNSYELSLATTEFLYYHHDDEILMLDIETGGVVSDNYFAEVGFAESESNINKGLEKKLTFTTY